MYFSCWFIYRTNNEFGSLCDSGSTYRMGFQEITIYSDYLCYFFILFRNELILIRILKIIEAIFVRNCL